MIRGSENSKNIFDMNTSLKSDRHMGYQDGNGDVTFAGDTFRHYNFVTITRLT